MRRDWSRDAGLARGCYCQGFQLHCSSRRLSQQALPQTQQTAVSRLQLSGLPASLQQQAWSASAGS